MAQQRDRNPFGNFFKNLFTGDFGDDANPYKTTSSASDIADQQDSLRDREFSGDTDQDNLKSGTDGFRFKDRVSNKATSSGFKIVTSALKKGGPIGFVLGTLGVGGLLAGALLSPASMLQRITEMVTEKFNTQDVSNTSRLRKLTSYKYTQAIDGNDLIEGKATKFGFGKKKYRFGTVNQKVIDALGAEGIKVEYETTITGRKRITAMEIDDPTLGGKKRFANAGELMEAWFDNDVTAQKVVASFEGKFGGLHDVSAKRARARMGATYRPLGVNTAEGETTEGKMRERVTENITDGEDVKRAKQATVSDVADPDETDLTRSAKESAGEALEGATDARTTGELSTHSVGKLTNVVDNISDACSMYVAMNQVIFIAKTTKAIMQARQAGAILTVASSLKAGDSTEEEVAGVLNMLTKTRPQERIVDGKKVVVGYERTAMESQGMQYVMTGMTGPLNESARKAQLGINDQGAAGGIVAFMSGTTGLLSLGGMNLSQYCKIAASMGVQLLVAVGVIAGCIATGGTACLAGITASAVARGLLMSTGVLALKAWMSYTIMKTISGTDVVSKDPETNGNMLVAGAGVHLGRIAMAGGNAPLERKEALAYLDAQDELIAKKADFIRKTHSPFDINTRHTMMGSIANSVTLQAAKMHSTIGQISGLLNLGKVSLKQIMPFAGAMSAAEKRAAREETMNLCIDPDYRSFANLDSGNDSQAKVAMDPFCNLVFGVPIQQLESTEYAPHMVLEYLAPGTFVKDASGKVTDKLENYHIDYKFSDSGELLNYEQARAQGRKIERYLSAVLSKNGKGECGEGQARSGCEVYFKPVNKDGQDCSFKPIVVDGALISAGYAFNYTSSQISTPCYDESGQNYEFEWKIDDRRSRDSYYFDIERGDPEIRTSSSGRQYQVETISSMSPKKRNASILDLIRADSQNKLLSHKVNCVDRGEVPYGMPYLDDFADDTERKAEREEGREGMTLGEKMFGLGKTLNDGKECILSENKKQRTMFALYFVDERVQCMLDGNQDCDTNALASR